MLIFTSSEVQRGKPQFFEKKSTKLELKKNNKMTTLKTLSTETFNYKNVEVVRIDTIEAGSSTLTCYPRRSWTINGKSAFTVKIEGQVKLASYLEKEASKGGTKTVLKDFNPSCGFHIEMNETIQKAIDELGLFFEHEVIETKF